LKDSEVKPSQVEPKPSSVFSCVRANRFIHYAVDCGTRRTKLFHIFKRQLRMSLKQIILLAVVCQIALALPSVRVKREEEEVASSAAAELNPIDS
uniref:Uncharacterized protein n=1 Tax=Megaselia scalaris TaxID=36166 RepID=T1GSS3_MEGSC